MEGAFLLEHNKLIDELSKGVENATRLQQHLSLMHHPPEEDLLLQRIVSSFEKGLMILNRGGSVRQARKRGGSAPIDSPVSVNETDHRRSARDEAKKRKLQPTWSEQIHSDNGLEGPSEDGFSWRKYGQKDILGAKHPRSYYRCRHRHAQGCWATKQVQRSDYDPNVFEVIYKGTHSCKEAVENPVPPPEPMSSTHHGGQQNDLLQSLKSKLTVDTLCLDTAADSLFTEFAMPAFVDDSSSYTTTPAAPVNYSGMSSYSSPLFHSPATSSANYEKAVAYPEAQAHGSSSIISPSGGITDEVAFDPNFLFDISGFVIGFSDI